MGSFFLSFFVIVFCVSVFLNFMFTEASKFFGLYESEFKVSLETPI